MAGTVERKLLTFPGRTGDRFSIHSGTPGRPSDGAWQSAPSQLDTILAAGYTKLESADVYQRVDLPPKLISDGPVRAICIAPDSSIHTANLAIAGVDDDISRARISPGNPWLGYLDDHNFAMVSVPSCMPGILWDDDDIYLDASKAMLGDSEIGGLAWVGWPLRLEVWRGDILPMRARTRAPMYGRAIVNMANASPWYVYACVDGRTRIDLEVDNTDDSGDGGTNGQDDVTVSVAQVIPRLAQPGDSGDARPTYVEIPIDGAASQTVVSGDKQVYQLSGDGVSIIRFAFDLASGSGMTQMRVVAWDD